MPMNTLDVPLSPARVILVDAITRCEIATKNLDEAQRVVTLAQEALDRSQATLESFADLDQRIVQHRVDALKRGGNQSLSRELREQQHERIFAQQEIEHATETLKTVEQDLETAREKVAAAEKERDSAATKVIGDQVDELLAELKEVDRRREHLLLIIRALGLPYPAGNIEVMTPAQRRQYLSGLLHSAGLPRDLDQWQEIYWRILTAFSESEKLLSSSKLFNQAAVLSKTGEQWKQFADRCLSDPEASIGEFPSLESLQQ